MSNVHSMQLMVAPECPVCQTVIDGVSNIGPEAKTPEPDDFTVCIYCSTILRFTTELGLRTCTQEEFDAQHPTLRTQLSTYKIAAAKVRQSHSN